MTTSDQPPPPFENDLDVVKYMGPKMEFVWERYITLIHEMIFIAGFTVLVYLNGLFAIQRSTAWVRVGVALTALGLAVLAMLTAIIWRVTSSYFMDREVFGNRNYVKTYFKLAGIKSVTNYDKYYSERHFSWLRVVFHVTKYLTPMLLILSWIFAGRFLYFNL